jgi:hypothetical protein
MHAIMVGVTITDLLRSHQKRALPLAGDTRWPELLYLKTPLVASTTHAHASLVPLTPHRVPGTLRQVDQQRPKERAFSRQGEYA